MSGFERQQAMAALGALVAALFVASQSAGARWRKPLRIAAIVGFAIALAFALVEIGLWLAAPRG